MLVLSRKEGERILIGRDIVITIAESRGNRVRLGIAAPQGVPINREEVLERLTRSEAGNSVDDGRQGAGFFIASN